MAEFYKQRKEIRELQLNLKKSEDLVDASEKKVEVIDQ